MRTFELIPEIPLVVRIRKLAQCAGGATPPAWDTFTPGAISPTTLPVAYELEGVFLRPVSLATPLSAIRLRRNGVPVIGLFTSTPVMAIFAKTRNSWYEISPVAELKIN